LADDGVGAGERRVRGGGLNGHGERTLPAMSRRDRRRDGTGERSPVATTASSRC